MKKYKQHVKSFKIWESEEFNVEVNEDVSKELSDEELKAEYGHAYIFLRAMKDAKSFSTFIEKLKTMKDYIKAFAYNTDKKTGSGKWGNIATIIGVLYKCIDPTVETKTKYYEDEKGYTRATYLEVKKDGKLAKEINTEDLMNADLNKKFLETLNDDFGDMEIPTDIKEVKELIAKNYNNAVKTASKEIALAKKRVNDYEDNMVDNTKRAAIDMTKKALSYLGL